MLRDGYSFLRAFANTFSASGTKINPDRGNLPEPWIIWVCLFNIKGFMAKKHSWIADLEANAALAGVNAARGVATF